MNDGPRKLGKNDSRKSKIIDLDDLKDKAITIKDKNKDKITGKGKSLVANKGLSTGKMKDLGKGKSLSTKGNGLSSSKKEYPSKLGKPSGKSGEEDILKVFSEFSDKLKKIPGITNKRIILGVLLIILICIVGVLAVNNLNTTHNETNTTNNTTPSNNHFDNGLIAFDYPLGWTVANGTAPIIVTVSKNENNSFVVMNEDLENLTFDQRVSIWRENILQSGTITHESNITIDNAQGYNVEFTGMVNNTTFNARGVAISKNTTVYFVMFIFDTSLLDYKNEMDLVINSFHVLH